MYTLEQLRAVAAILGLPMYKSKIALNEEIIDAMRQNKRELEKTAKHQASSRKSVSRKKTVKKAPAKKATAGESKSRSGKRSPKEVRELYTNAIGRVGDQGYREVVAALAHPKEQKIWILMRKPKTTKPQARATLWGQSGASPRHLYGGERYTDKELIEMKLKKGFKKEPALLKLARATMQK